jgi:hypothetical protein
MSDDVELDSDLLWGASAIGRFIGKTLVETQYLIRTKQLPIGRLGAKTLFASKRQLRRYLASKTNAGKESAA